MNVEEIKRKVNGSDGVGQYCYHPDGFYGDRQLNADDDVLYLLSIIEQATNALDQIKYDYEQSEDAKVASRNMYTEAMAALKAIRGN